MNVVERWWSRRRSVRAAVRAHRRLIRKGEFRSNEIGAADPRGRPQVSTTEVEAALSELVGHEIKLPESAVAMSGPASCPACGAAAPTWGCDPQVVLRRPQIHPIVWDEDAWMADSFVCGECSAGWIEPDLPAPIAWVRPYWSVGEGL